MKEEPNINSSPFKNSPESHENTIYEAKNNESPLLLNSPENEHVYLKTNKPSFSDLYIANLTPEELREKAHESLDKIFRIIEEEAGSQYSPYLFENKYVYKRTPAGKYMFQKPFVDLIIAVYKKGLYTPDSLYDMAQGLIPYSQLYFWYKELNVGKYKHGGQNPLYPLELRKKAMELLKTKDSETVYFELDRKISYACLESMKYHLKHNRAILNDHTIKVPEEIKEKVWKDLETMDFPDVRNKYPDIDYRTIHVWEKKVKNGEKFIHKEMRHNCSHINPELKKEIFEKLKTKSGSEVFKEYKGEIVIHTLEGWRQKLKKQGVAQKLPYFYMISPTLS